MLEGTPKKRKRLGFKSHNFHLCFELFLSRKGGLSYMHVEGWKSRARPSHVNSFSDWFKCPKLGV